MEAVTEAHYVNFHQKKTAFELITAIISLVAAIMQLNNWFL